VAEINKTIAKRKRINGETYKMDSEENINGKIEKLASE
jgi:hypothetical protein